MAQNLFAMPGAVGGSSGGGGGNKPLVEFRAGKMTYNDTTKKVTPDKRKGQIQLNQGMDGLMRFQWKDRTNGQVVDELYIFPEEATFKRIKQCTTGRVYLLEFKTGKMHFYWMQDPSDSKDEENANKINQYINNPPNPEQQQGMGNEEQNALMQMFSQRAQQQQRSGGGQNPAVAMGDLQSILSSIGMPSSAISGVMGRQPTMQPRQQQVAQGATAAQGSNPQAVPQGRAPKLSTLLNAETVRPLLNNPAIQDKLLPFLPHERRTPEELRDIFSSPQFQQSLDAFGEALESGQLGELVRQFGLETNGPTSIQQFLQAVQNQQAKKEKDDDNMDTK
eukprot:TRINITY_DN1548_c0_g1_i1.p1 TRINITY_DN1548_c0_g1~~TRINITY_DN1548_c0_g1_i1.p1  ORF type:complete len:335 (+),score=113.17 TRINITY_DN1548_c0_g1_i1:160-1164(+)